MKVVAQSVIVFFFVFFSIVLLLLTTIRFQILNSSFLFSNFQKHGVYQDMPQMLAESLSNDPNMEKADRASYADMAKGVKPEDIQKLIESNLTHVFDFIYGKSTDVTFMFPVALGTAQEQDINFSLSQNPEMEKRLATFSGVGNSLTIVWVVLIFILGGLFALYGRVVGAWWKARRLLAYSGFSILLLGVLAKIESITIGKELLKGKEPSQKILGLLVNSLLPDVTITWIIIGVALVIIWFILRMSKKIAK